MKPAKNCKSLPAEPSLYDIDKFRLDEVWESIPREYYEYAEALANARRDHARAEAEVEVVHAELAAAVRTDPQRYELDKVTVDAVKETVVLQSAYQKALKAAIDAKHHVDICAAAVGVMDYKKKAAEKLVDLFLAQYFARPRASERSRNDWDKRPAFDRRG